MITFAIISLIAGTLTVFTPCVLPLLPVIFGSSAAGGRKSTPFVVVLSLGVSIILFTYLLKVSTLFVHVPPEAWSYLSGAIIFIFGLTLIFPSLWERIPGMARLSIGSNKLLAEGGRKKSAWGDVIVGAALGPVFSSCSPTYFVILATALPASFALGTLYLLAYVLGLSILLFLVALLGNRFAGKLVGFSNPNSALRKWLGVLFVILAVAVAFGFDKQLESSITGSGYFDFTKVEESLLKTASPVSNTKKENAPVQEKAPAGDSLKPLPTNQEKNMSEEKYKEIVNPSGFVNTGGKSIRIGDYVGKDVVMIDFMTYSCINCQRTFPYLEAWYQKYKDQGFVIIGIHTPEFAFEHDINNVKDAMRRFGLTFPVVLDNKYGTWSAYGNQYWPRKYIIDIHGNIVYDHIGEGGYAETEMEIRKLLAERDKFLGQQTGSDLSADSGLVSSSVPEVSINTNSPETYFGAYRNQYLGNGTPGKTGEQSFTAPEVPKANTLYLSGKWNMSFQSAVSVKDSEVIYKYDASDVYLVASSDKKAELEIWQDGKVVSFDSAGADVDKNGTVSVEESRLYKLIHNSKPGEHTLKIIVKDPGVSFYAFTFG